jgi:putative transferase (TIGR04331 family)
VTGEIARAVLSLLPRHFPTLYLEGFLQARREVAAEERGLPAATVSLTAWLFNERFKFLAAEAAAEGRVLITAQHGGNYGISRYLSAERHERSIADRFMVWGWATDETPDCRNVPNPKLAQLRQMRRRATTRGDVLFVATAHQRYLYRFHSQPVGTQFAEYVEWQQRFFRALPSSRHHAVVLRPSATDHGHGITDRIRTNFPEVRIDRRPTFDEQLSSAGLVVVDHCATTYLQSLAVNAPTVVFWDPQRWELRPEAEPFFEMLREVGILWDAPEEAARQVDAVYGDPHAWWRSDRVQKVRRTFVKRYALDSDDWASRWVEALSAEVSRDSRTVGVVQKP